MNLDIQQQILHLLEEHQLRKTKSRIAMLEIFIRRNHALSHAEIEDNAAKDQDLDRVTIYRTLKSFEEQGIIHKVLDDSGSAKYALCHHHHAENHQHYDKHIHFNCTHCKRTFCLENVPIPQISLPEEYHFESFNFLAQGVCKDCLKK